MRLRRVVTDEGAVSPVIGVVLMIAITVVLAAVMGTYTLGLDDDVSDTVPNARLEFQTGASSTSCSLGSGTDLEIVHQGGDELRSENVYLKDGSGRLNWKDDCGGPTTVTASSSVGVSVDSGDTVRVVWTGDDKTATLAKWTESDV